MPWVRLDDQFAQHPKIVQAGPLGLALHVAALCYCNQYLTDGFVPRGTAIRLLDLTDQARLSQDLIDDLVDVGLWEPIHNGYQIHDYSDYQPSRLQVLEAKEQKRTAGQAGGQASAKARAQAQEEAAAQAESNPVPVPKVPVKPKPLKPPSSQNQDDADFDTFWDRYPLRHGKKVSKGPAKTAWCRLTSPNRVLALVAVEHYRDACNQKLTLAKDAVAWLRQEAWEDWQTPAAPSNGSKNRGINEMWGTA